MISVIIAAASCILLLVILTGIQWCAMSSEESPGAEKGLIAFSARVASRLSSMRATDVLLAA